MGDQGWTEYTPQECGDFVGWMVVDMLKQYAKRIEELEKQVDDQEKEIDQADAEAVRA